MNIQRTFTLDEIDNAFAELEKILRKEKTPKESDNWYQWCEKCHDSTKHGFGLGCLRCLGWQNRKAA